jgi:hypothetical protein
VAVFLLDSLFQAGYGYSREQAKGSLLDKAMQCPRKLKADLALISTAMSVARRRGL